MQRLGAALGAVFLCLAPAIASPVGSGEPGAVLEIPTAPEAAPAWPVVIDPAVMTGDDAVAFGLALRAIGGVERQMHREIAAVTIVQSGPGQVTAVFHHAAAERFVAIDVPLPAFVAVINLALAMGGGALGDGQ